MSAKLVRPTGKRLLVASTAPPEQTSGGIVLVPQWQQPTGRGIVIAIGGTVEDIIPGNQVLYSWINGQDVEHDGKTRRLLHQNEILALVND